MKDWLDVGVYTSQTCTQQQLYFSAGRGVVWFDRYGRKNGFIVYLLRYFLLQNWGRNLHIIDKEFLALAALALGRPNEKHYQQIPLRPTPRCVSIGSWFQVSHRM